MGGERKKSRENKFSRWTSRHLPKHFGKRKKIYIAAIHSIWMMFGVFIWLRQPYVFDFEFAFCQDVKSIERIVDLGQAELIEKYESRFLFLNTSKNIEAKKAGTLTFSVVDKNLLLKTLKILNENTKFFDVVILDVFFDADTTSIDASARIQKQIDLLGPKIILTDEIIKTNDKTVANINALRSDYRGLAFYDPTLNSAFYRYDYAKQMDNGTYRKQTPLVCYETVHKKKACHPYFFDLFYNYAGEMSVCQNIVVPDMYLGSGNLYEGQVEAVDSLYFGVPFLKRSTPKITSKNSNFYNLGIFNQTSDIALHTGKKPIIIIGNFDTDDHYTTSGRIPGPLVIANIFIALESQKNRLSIYYFLFLFVTFYIISYLAIFYFPGDSKIPAKYLPRKFKFISEFLFENADYIILLMATLVGKLFFNNYLFLFYNLTYLWGLKKIIKYYQSKKQRKE